MKKCPHSHLSFAWFTASWRLHHHMRIFVRYPPPLHGGRCAANLFAIPSRTRAHTYRHKYVHTHTKTKRDGRHSVPSKNEMADRITYKNEIKNPPLTIPPHTRAHTQKRNDNGRPARNTPHKLGRASMRKRPRGHTWVLPLAMLESRHTAPPGRA